MCPSPEIKEIFFCVDNCYPPLIVKRESSFPRIVRRSCYYATQRPFSKSRENQDMEEDKKEEKEEEEWSGSQLERERQKHNKFVRTMMRLK